MKNLVLATFLCFCFVGLAHADNYETECDNGDFLTYSNQGHEHCYSRGESVTNNQTIINQKIERDDPVGVGVDLLLYTNPKADVVQEYKYDWQNEEHSTFTVVKTKVALWDVIKGFFKKGE